jgi:hypothetical protein
MRNQKRTRAPLSEDLKPLVWRGDYTRIAEIASKELGQKISRAHVRDVATGRYPTTPERAAIYNRCWRNILTPRKRNI